MVDMHVFSSFGGTLVAMPASTIRGNHVFCLHPSRIYLFCSRSLLRGSFSKILDHKNCNTKLVYYDENAWLSKTPPYLQFSHSSANELNDSLSPSLQAPIALVRALTTIVSKTCSCPVIANHSYSKILSIIILIESFYFVWQSYM